MNKTHQTKREVIKVGRHLSELVTISDAAGNLLHKMVRPLMVEFHPHDVIQVIVGATILSLPVAFTEEVWHLGERLPLRNILIIGLLSLSFISLFVYYHSYQHHLKTHWQEFLTRVFSTYFISLLVVGVILMLIQLPGSESWFITLKRMIIVALPASMSATVADMIK